MVPYPKESIDPEKNRGEFVLPHDRTSYLNHHLGCSSHYHSKGYYEDNQEESIEDNVEVPLIGNPNDMYSFKLNNHSIRFYHHIVILFYPVLISLSFEILLSYIVPAGTLVVISCFVLHRSGTNLSRYPSPVRIDVNLLL